MPSHIQWNSIWNRYELIAVTSEGLPEIMFTWTAYDFRHCVDTIEAAQEKRESEIENWLHGADR